MAVGEASAPATLVTRVQNLFKSVAEDGRIDRLEVEALLAQSGVMAPSTRQYLFKVIATLQPDLQLPPSPVSKPARLAPPSSPGGAAEGALAPAAGSEERGLAEQQDPAAAPGVMPMQQAALEVQAAIQSLTQLSSGLAAGVGRSAHSTQSPQRAKFDELRALVAAATSAATRAVAAALKEQAAGSPARAARSSQHAVQRDAGCSPMPLIRTPGGMSADEALPPARADPPGPQHAPSQAMPAPQLAVGSAAPPADEQAEQRQVGEPELGQAGSAAAPAAHAGEASHAAAALEALSGSPAQQLQPPVAAPVELPQELQASVARAMQVVCDPDAALRQQQRMILPAARDEAAAAMEASRTAQRLVGSRFDYTAARAQLNALDATAQQAARAGGSVNSGPLLGSLQMAAAGQLPAAAPLVPFAQQWPAEGDEYAEAVRQEVSMRIQSATAAAAAAAAASKRGAATRQPLKAALSSSQPTTPARRPLQGQHASTPHTRVHALPVLPLPPAAAATMLKPAAHSSAAPAARPAQPAGAVQPSHASGQVAGPSGRSRPNIAFGSRSEPLVPSPTKPVRKAPKPQAPQLSSRPRGLPLLEAPPAAPPARGAPPAPAPASGAARARAGRTGRQPAVRPASVRAAKAAAEPGAVEEEDEATALLVSLMSAVMEQQLQEQQQRQHVSSSSQPSARQFLHVMDLPAPASTWSQAPAARSPTAPRTQLPDAVAAEQAYSSASQAAALAELASRSQQAAAVQAVQQQEALEDLAAKLDTWRSEATHASPADQATPVGGAAAVATQAAAASSAAALLGHADGLLLEVLVESLAGAPLQAPRTGAPVPSSSHAAPEPQQRLQRRGSLGHLPGMRALRGLGSSAAASSGGGAPGGASAAAWEDAPSGADCQGKSGMPTPAAEAPPAAAAPGLPKAAAHGPAAALPGPQANLAQVRPPSNAQPAASAAHSAPAAAAAQLAGELQDEPPPMPRRPLGLGAAALPRAPRWLAAGGAQRGRAAAPVRVSLPGSDAFRDSWESASATPASSVGTTPQVRHWASRVDTPGSTPPQPRPARVSLPPPTCSDSPPQLRGAARVPYSRSTSEAGGSTALQQPWQPAVSSSGGAVPPALDACAAEQALQAGALLAAPAVAPEMPAGGQASSSGSRDGGATDTQAVLDALPKRELWRPPSSKVWDPTRAHEQATPAAAAAANASAGASSGSASSDLQAASFLTSSGFSSFDTVDACGSSGSDSGATPSCGATIASLRGSAAAGGVGAVSGSYCDSAASTPLSSLLTAGTSVDGL